MEVVDKDYHKAFVRKWFLGFGEKKKKKELNFIWKRASVYNVVWNILCLGLDTSTCFTACQKWSIEDYGVCACTLYRCKYTTLFRIFFLLWVRLLTKIATLLFLTGKYTSSYALFSKLSIKFACLVQLVVSFYFYFLKQNINLNNISFTIKKNRELFQFL